MVGETNRRLYTLSPTNRKAYEVGQNLSIPFDVGAEIPADVASHERRLYMIDGGRRVLYVLDTETGVARNVAAMDDICEGELRPLGMTSYGGKLYIVAKTRRSNIPNSVNETILCELDIEDNNDIPVIRDCTKSRLFGVTTPSGLFTINDQLGEVLCLGEAGFLRKIDTSTGETQEVIEFSNKFRIAYEHDRYYVVGQTTNSSLRIFDSNRQEIQS